MVIKNKSQLFYKKTSLFKGRFLIFQGMRWGVVFVLYSLAPSSGFSQNFASELQLGVDYFNTFHKKNYSGFQEVNEGNSVLGLKLQTNIYHNFNFGLSLDMISIKDNVRLLKRSFFYGIFLNYDCMSRHNRFKFNFGLDARMAKLRSKNRHPYFEDAPQSLYAGLSSEVNYKPLKSLPNVKIYIGFKTSFPTFRHSMWANVSGDYGNLNFPYIGLAYAIGNLKE